MSFLRRKKPVALDPSRLKPSDDPPSSPATPSTPRTPTYTRDGLLVSHTDNEPSLSDTEERTRQQMTDRLARGNVFLKHSTGRSLRGSRKRWVWCDMKSVYWDRARSRTTRRRQGLPPRRSQSPGPPSSRGGTRYGASGSSRSTSLAPSDASNSYPNTPTAFAGTTGNARSRGSSLVRGRSSGHLGVGPGSGPSSAESSEVSDFSDTGTVGSVSKHFRHCPVYELMKVLPGFQTNTFAGMRRKLEKHPENAKLKDTEARCFSLVFRTRTLDLECTSATECQYWLETFGWLVAQDTVSKPFNLIHVTHVNEDYEWSGQNLQETFSLAEMLGAGSYGQVFRAVHNVTGVEMAMKMLFVFDAKSAEDIRREVDILKECRHANIVGFYGCWGPDEEDRMWILMELAALGSIMDRMKTVDLLLSEQQIAHVCRCCLNALAYLHYKKHILHRDVKAMNILIGSTGEVKLTDFGISKKHDQSKYCAPAGSPLYMAPEAMTGKASGFASDIWSLGITAIELAEGQPPRSNLRDVRQIMQTVVRGSPPQLAEPDRWSPDFVDFVKKCLEKDPTKRPETLELLSHPFVVHATDPAVLSNLLPAVTAPPTVKRRRSFFNLFRNSSSGEGGDSGGGGESKASAGARRLSSALQAAKQQEKEPASPAQQSQSGSSAASTPTRRRGDTISRTVVREDKDSEATGDGTGTTEPLLGSTGSHSEKTSRDYGSVEPVKLTGTGEEMEADASKCTCTLCHCRCVVL